MSSLDGIRVLDLSRLLPGPFLTMILADLGADVVKIEDPKVGDYIRAFPPQKAGMGGRYLAVNRGKRSIALDLKEARAKEAFLRMAAQADVVVESFRPGVMDKLGVGWSALSAVNPRLVMCSISGYGQTGPYVHRAGHDLNYIGLAGVLAMGAEKRGAMPAMPGIQIADFAGGGLWGATAVLAALFGRERTGKGQHLDISMTEGAMALLAAELGNLDCGARPTRGSEALNGAMACYGVYRCKDDRFVSVGALEPKFWIAFNQALGRKPDISELAAPAAKQEAIREEIATILVTKTRDEWVAALAQHDCLLEPVLELEELPSHPLHQAREMFITVDGGPAGPLRHVRTPLGPPVRPTPPPALGADGKAVLADYGFSDADITAVLG
ncbi:MAG TPA: CaiB/BaiF CoA-transferase family protein [Kofleriaceae bacterium]|nr:CaiB/BaiF CoA-transferase family protein [Kofleriaceae bacterium]